MTNLNKRYFILRLIAFPLLFVLIMTKVVYDGVLISFRMLWGGFELVEIHQDRTTIKHIYEKVSELVEQEKTKTNGE